MRLAARTRTGLAAVAILSSLPGVSAAHGEDDPVLSAWFVDEFEVRDPGADATLGWDTDLWFGKDLAKLWIKSVGERRDGDTPEANLELLYSRAVATYWDFQAGIRHDFEPSADRTWLALAVKGLAPYFFEIDATVYMGQSGHTALRIEAEYELLLTQRWILTPQAEFSIYGKDDPAAGYGSGLSGTAFGIRLRYEIRREIAPYLGVSFSRRHGTSADFDQNAGRDSSETELVLGLRAWF